MDDFEQFSYLHLPLISFLLKVEIGLYVFILIFLFNIYSEAVTPYFLFFHFKGVFPLHHVTYQINLYWPFVFHWVHVSSTLGADEKMVYQHLK